uniref:Uncharacterized protein n=1 Tax=viral metagenome TaxID=1070528 RepID=A0A6M3JFC1_9ZZZZ
MARIKMPPCNNPECCASTNIADHESFGSGELDDYGFWEKPCSICARSYEKATGKIAWPYTHSLNK